MSESHEFCRILFFPTFSTGCASITAKQRAKELGAKTEQELLGQRGLTGWELEAEFLWRSLGKLSRISPRPPKQPYRVPADYKSSPRYESTCARRAHTSTTAESSILHKSPVADQNPVVFLPTDPVRAPKHSLGYALYIVDSVAEAKSGTAKPHHQSL